MAHKGIEMLRIDFINMLHQEDMISKEQLHSLIQYMKEQRKNEIQAIIYMGLLDKLAVAQAVAKRYSLEFVSLRNCTLPAVEQLSQFSAEKLYGMGVLPYEVPENTQEPIKLAVVDPTDNTSIEVVTALTGRRVTPYMALRSDISHAIDDIFSMKDEKENESISMEFDVVELVHKLLAQAVRLRASDIHIEGMPDKMRVRYRIDGMLREYQQYPKEWLNIILSRLKVISGMDIAEKRLDQDGKFSDTIDKNEYDFRVSMIPTIYGEKSVLRIAPKRIVFNRKKELGLREYDLAKFDRILSSKHGMVLVTGPTGCGKTTTLYSVLSEVNTSEKNTVTVEDPVEIGIAGVNQVQVNANGGMTFSKALRAILRQDPDVIMIGEIRDTETAKMAVQASITGHLVLSTLHTNSAASAVNRLVNMGIERYLISDALTGIVSQRLVRKLCPHCKAQTEVGKMKSKRYGLELGSRIYEPVGCEDCGQTGYLGRTSIFEILELDEKMRKMISEPDFDTNVLNEYAINEGMVTLYEGGKKLVEEGVTSCEEIRSLSTLEGAINESE